MCYCVCIWLRKTLLGHLSYAVSSPRDFYPMWLSLLSCRVTVRTLKSAKQIKIWSSSIYLHVNHNLGRTPLWKRPTKQRQPESWPVMPPQSDRCLETARWGDECIFWHISLREPIWLCGSLHFRLFQSKHWHICILIDAHLCLFYPPPAPERPDAGLRNLDVVLTADKSAEQTCWSGSRFTHRPLWEERYRRQVKVT